MTERLSRRASARRRPGGLGGWSWNLQGVRLVLYRLPQLVGQPTVYIVEGEKDAERLEAAGLPATCNAMGAGKWREDYARQLVAAGVREVVILADNDTAGVDHGRTVARGCVAAGLVVKMPRLSGWPPVRPKQGEDVSDWLDDGHSVDDLAALVRAASAVTAEQLEALPLRAGAPTTGTRTVWSLAKSAAELVAAGGTTLEAVDYPLAARGVSQKSMRPADGQERRPTRPHGGPRSAASACSSSTGTTHPRPGNALVGLGAETVPTLKTLTRDVAPPFSDSAAWQAFPLEEYDVVVIDSWDTFAEGAGEQDSRRSTLALSPLLDMVRRERAPAVILLCNVTKDGAAGRGSGTVEDRADNVFEVRDVTGFTPTGKRPWWEELPSAARGEWQARATRRAGHDRPERIRLAFIATKYRDDDEPAPFVLELDFTAEPWALHAVTAELEAAGDASRADALAQVTRAQAQAADALVGELHRRVVESARHCSSGRTSLMELTSSSARRGAAQERRGWSVALEAVDGKSTGVVLRVRRIPRPTVCPTPPLNTRVSAPANAVGRMETGQPHLPGVNPATDAGMSVGQMRLKSPEISRPDDPESSAEEGAL